MVVGHLFTVKGEGHVRVKRYVLHKRQLSAEQRSNVRRCTAHVVGQKCAVGSRIGQQSLFIKGLRQIKGLFRGIAVNTVCFALQTGEVKELRRRYRLFLAGHRNTLCLCGFTDCFQCVRCGSVREPFAYRFCAG